MKFKPKDLKLGIFIFVPLLILVIVGVVWVSNIYFSSNDHSSDQPRVEGECSLSKPLCVTFHETGGGCNLAGENCIKIDNTRLFGVDKGDTMRFDQESIFAGTAIIGIKEFDGDSITIVIHERVGCCETDDQGNQVPLYELVEKKVAYGESVVVNENNVEDAASSTTKITITKSK